MREAQLDAQRLLAPVPDSLDEAVAIIRTDGPGRMTLPACPQMHGTGFITAIGTLASGGCLVTLDNPSLDAVELWDAVERNKVQSFAIVGDAFAKPMRSEEHTSELQSLLRLSYAVFFFKKN